MKITRLLLLAALASPAVAQQQPFDLAGPGLRVSVAHAGITLPIAQVPNLAAGDRVTVNADLPPDQGVRYVLVASFLRGATNPPPKDWFSAAKTWERKKNGLDLTVPAGARQMILFLMPETGGGYDAIVSAVRKQPGAFVRASQELNQASLDRARLDTFLDGVHRLERSHPERIESVSPILTRSLSIKLKAECLEQAIDLQAACLTQSRDSLLLADSHSSSLTETLIGAPTDLALQLAATPEGGYGYYSPYIGVVRDLARIFGAFQSTQFQYIPALARARDDRLSLLLNAAPSFAKPKSVMVAALPAIEAPEPPPLRAVDPRTPLCMSGGTLLLPVEGAPLIYATRYAHDTALRVGTVDIPVIADAEQGGFVVAPGAAIPVSLGTAFEGVLHGRWGFTPFDGPRFRLQRAGGATWRPVDGDTASLVAGRDNRLVLQGGSAACVEGVALRQPSGGTVALEWKADPDGRIAATLPAAQVTRGNTVIAIRQQGIAEPQVLTLTTLGEVGRIDDFALHAGDATGVLTGTRLDIVASLSVEGKTFKPATVTRVGKVDQLVLTATATDWTADAEKTGRITLKDGRVLPVTFTVAPPRPVTTLIAKTIQRAPVSSTMPITLTGEDAVPQDARLTFSLRAEGATRLTGRETVEIATLDGRAAATITAANGYTVQSDRVGIVAFDPAAALGGSAYGPLRYRIVQGDAASDWAPLASLVRLPVLTALACDKGEARCTLAGRNLFLLASVAGDAAFTGAASVPDGFTGSSLSVPRPSGGTLFLKPRDSDTLVATVAIPKP